MAVTARVGGEGGKGVKATEGKAAHLQYVVIPRALSNSDLLGDRQRVREVLVRKLV